MAGVRGLVNAAGLKLLDWIPRRSPEGRERNDAGIFLVGFELVLPISLVSLLVFVGDVDVVC